MPQQQQPQTRQTWTVPTLRRIDASAAQSASNGNFPDLQAQS